MASVAVFGVGDVGQNILRGLVTYKEITRIWAFSLNICRLEVIAADIGAIAGYREHSPEIMFRQLDIRNSDQLSEALMRAKPDVIVNAATLQSWWAITQLPSEIRRKLEVSARFGPWLPMHLTLALKLMRSQSEVDSKIPVVNVAFPDAVNPVLGRLGLAPTCGAGNSELLHAGIRYLTARHLRVPMREIQIQMLAHHSHVDYFLTGLEEVDSLHERPFWLRVLYNGQDVTTDINPTELLVKSGRILPRGRAISVRTAESAVKNVMRLVRDDPTITHVAGPVGLIGGYDVRLSRNCVEVVLPANFSLEAAQEINAQAQRGDGIQAIEPSGSVIFTEKASQTMKEVLGYDCQKLNPEESEVRALELKERLVALHT